MLESAQKNYEEASYPLHSIWDKRKFEIFYSQFGQVAYLKSGKYFVVAGDPRSFKIKFTKELLAREKGHNFF